MILKPFVEQRTNNYKQKVGQENEKQAAYFLDFELKNSKNYMIMHNVKLKYKDRTVQIDHLIISRIGIYVIESKFFSGEIEIQKNKDWIIHYKKEDIAISSPIEQNRRHILVLEDILKNEEIFTKIIGLKKSPEIHNLILISNKTIIKGKTPKNVIKQDKFMDYVESQGTFASIFLNPLKTVNDMLSIISQETLLDVSNKILSFDIYKEETETKSKPKTISKKTSKNDLESRLKELRLTLSKQEDIKPYMVFSNKELLSIIELKPKNKDEFLKISGVGKIKLEKYGELFLKEINQ